MPKLALKEAPAVEEVALRAPRANFDLPFGCRLYSVPDQAATFQRGAGKPMSRPNPMDSCHRILDANVFSTGKFLYLPVASTLLARSKSGITLAARDHYPATSIRQTRRILTKYIASLAGTCVSLYDQHPLSTVLLLRRFQPVLWALFSRCVNRQVIHALIDSFEVLGLMWGRRFTERVLARALRAAAQTNGLLHARVC